MVVGLLPSAGCSGRTSGATPPVVSQRVETVSELKVEISAVEIRRLAAEATFTGNLLPRRRTSMNAEVEGIIEEIADIGPRIEIDIDGRHYAEQLSILPGQEVHSGDVLVQLDATVFELEVAVAEAKLAKAEADLAKVKAWERPESIARLDALVRESEALRALAAANYERVRSLAAGAAVSESELDRVAAELATSEATLASQLAVLRQAKAGPTAEEIAVQEALVRQAEAELRQQQRLVAKTTIRAPYDGVITEINVEVGDHVSTSTGPLMELLDLRFLVAEVGVPESYLGKVQLQDRAKVSIAGAVEPVDGLVVSINDKVDPESRSFRVRIAIDNSGGRFVAGQFARVSLPLVGGEPTAVVPSRAVTFIEGQPGVFLYEDGVVRRRAVTLGISDDTHTAILSVLTSGSLVVVDDPNLLIDGMRVQVGDNSSTAGRDETF